MERDLDFEQPIAETERLIRKLQRALNGDAAAAGMSDAEKAKMASELATLEKKYDDQLRDIYGNLTAWQSVQIARHPKRPVLQDYLRLLFSDFLELHGDRAFSDDTALIGGFAKFGDKRVMVVGHNKGKSVEENVARNFGMARPDGYRKALRLMKIAEKYNIPIITVIDTPGAYPGLDAEERGQAEAIAHNLMAMATIEVPIVSVVTGEGGSGGALGIGVGDAILMLRYAIYSVISPEGCASILWRDAAYSPQAAEALKLTAPSLHQLGIADEVIEEPLGGAHHDYEKTAAAMTTAIATHLAGLVGLSTEQLLAKRFDKYAKMGVFERIGS